MKCYTQCHGNGASGLPRQLHKWWEFLQYNQLLTHRREEKPKK